MPPDDETGTNIPYRISPERHLAPGGEHRFPQPGTGASQRALLLREKGNGGREGDRESLHPRTDAGVDRASLRVDHPGRIQGRTRISPGSLPTDGAGNPPGTRRNRNPRRGIRGDRTEGPPRPHRFEIRRRPKLSEIRGRPGQLRILSPEGKQNALPRPRGKDRGGRGIPGGRGT